MQPPSAPELYGAACRHHGNIYFGFVVTAARGSVSLHGCMHVQTNLSSERFRSTVCSHFSQATTSRFLGVLVHVAAMKRFPANEKFHFLGLIETPKVFGLTVCDVLKWPVERDLDVVELWAGKGSVAKAGDALNLKVAEFDILSKPEENITSVSGFRLALDLVLRLRRLGLLHMAPVCSSFGFMNSSRCQRDEDNRFAGDWSYEKVHAGNVMADIAAFFLFVGWARDVHCSMENPIGSTIFKYGGVKVAVDKLELVEALAYRCAYDDAPMGERYLKGFKFFATGAWIVAIRKPCKCKPKCHHPTVTKLDLGAVRGIELICLLVDFLYELAFGSAAILPLYMVM